MQGNFRMLRTVLSLASICSIVHGSGVHHAGAPLALGASISGAPVVTAASSQYFERTFNRLIAAPPVVPVAPAPPVFVHTPQALPLPFPPPQAFPVQPVQPVQSVPVQPVQPPQPTQPVEPNVAIAIATAYAAPVATILLPPYPFGFPPGYGFIPQEQPNNIDGKAQEPEQTTTRTTTQVDVQTTIREPESTTPLPDATDNSFGQASNQDVNFNQFLNPASQGQPSNQDVNFRQYLAPAPSQPQNQPSKQNVNFNQFLTPATQGQPSNQDVNFRQYLAPTPPRPQIQPSNQNVNFRQYLAPATPQPQSQPSNQNVNFRQYLSPAAPRPQAQPQAYAVPQPLPHHHHPHTHVHLHPLRHGKPQKLKTLVEVVKAPLAYIAPPPLPQYPHNHEAVKVVKHVHTFVPARAKLIIRPVSHHHEVRSAPIKVYEYKAALTVKAAPRVQNVGAGNSREIELTTFRSIPRPNNTPPRL